MAEWLWWLPKPLGKECAGGWELAYPRAGCRLAGAEQRGYLSRQVSQAWILPLAEMNQFRVFETVFLSTEACSEQNWRAVEGLEFRRQISLRTSKST